MRIGIDARMLGPHNAGLGRYTEQLINHLQIIDTENEYVLFLKDDNFDLVTIQNERFAKVRADIHWYGWEEQVKFTKIIKRHDVDLMHFPHWNVPLSYNDPFVITLHDLIMYHYPRKEASTLGPLAYWVKDKVMRLVVSRAAKRARNIIATSEFTKIDISKTLLLPMEKIHVTYQAPTVIEERTVHEDTAESQTFNIAKPYVLYVGNAYPHKNLGGLVKTWELFVKEYGDEYQLVLAGKENYFYRRLKDRIPESIKDSVVLTGFVTDEQLRTLYTEARLFAFPSLYEGIGLPPLEAMQYGIPVVSSNRSCMPEILGEGALFVDPENYEQFADAIYKALTDEDVRFELQKNAKKELTKYSWERLAEQTLEVYKKVCKT